MLKLMANLPLKSVFCVTLLVFVFSVSLLAACELGASRLKLAENSLVPEPTGEMRAYHVKMEKLGIYSSWREKSVS